jgi:predicted transcriptional regulator YdeE
MEPKIIQKEAMVIAGVAGSGDETAKAWEAFMKISQIHPLTNQVKDGAEGYEVRLYPNQGTEKVYVGQRVSGSDIPAEYKIFSLPAATYAEFEICPAKGYESSNDAMSKWLETNAAVYKQGEIEGMKYAVEVYDQRYKGEKDPKSVVGIWIPVVPVATEDLSNNMFQMILGPLEEISGRIEEFTGAAVSKKVLQGKEDILAAKNPEKVALWMKKVIDRLDSLDDAKTCKKIMAACGRNCNKVNSKDTEEARQMRLQCKSEEDYLEKFLQPPGKGVRNERSGNTLIQYYTPQEYGQANFGHGIRCYCSLVNMLPEGVNVSPTYCQCSRAFVQAHWETVLGRPVKVELGPTAISGSHECKFMIHL